MVKFEYTNHSLSRSCVAATVSPRSDIDIARVNHIENQKSTKNNERII